MQPGKFLPANDDLIASKPASLEKLSDYRDHYIPSRGPDNAFLDTWRVINKHRVLILACMLISVTLTGIAAFRMTKMYEGVTRIAINRETSDILNGKNNEMSDSGDDYDYTVTLDTQAKIIESDSLALTVIQRLHLEQDPFFAKTAHLERLPGTDPTTESQREVSLVRTFLANLSVEKVPHTRLIEIHYSSPNPKLSAEIANTLANEYIEQNFKTKYESTMQASDWLSHQLAELQMKVETSEEKLVKYQKEHGIVGLDDKTNIVSDRLDELNKELTAAENDRIMKEANYQLTLSNDADRIVQVMPDSALEHLIKQQADVQAELAQVTTQFGPQYPKVIALQNQLEDIKRSMRLEMGRIAGRMKNDYIAAQEREKLLKAALAQQMTLQTQQNESAIEYNVLKREADTNRQLYNDLLGKLKEAGIAAGLKSSNIRIVNPAQIPISPSRPNKTMMVMVATLFGLGFGVVLAFVMESLDSSVRTPEEVQLASALPSLAVIPLRTLEEPTGARKLLASKSVVPNEANDAVGMIAASAPSSHIAESYRALRTSILLSSLDNPPKVLLITSALPKDGKSTTAVNTAIVLAQKGGKVLLVDCDLRRPSIHRTMRLRPALGLSSVLAGLSPAEGSIQQSRQMKNLYVLPSGPIPPQPSELLASKAMREHLRKWREEYDHVILDSPPVLSVTDAVLLSVEADAVVLVIRSGKTTKQALRHATEILQHANARLMGVVLNAFDLKSPDSYYYYYYGSQYGGEYYGRAYSSHAEKG